MKNRKDYMRQWRQAQRAAIKSGAEIGTCPCGNRAVKIDGGAPVCERCDRIERENHAGELARSVCGYERRGVLATNSGRT